MKRQLPFRALTVVTLLMLSTISAIPAALVTFDDLHENGTGSFVPNGYEGLTWSNFFCFNAILATNRPGLGTSGFYYGMVSTSNVAYNPFGTPCEIDSVTNFNFLSAYFTGAWHSNLNIEVQGFNGAQEIYDTIVVASATNATLFMLNYLDIDRLYFNSYGGQVAFPDDGGNHFAMDNMTIEFVPEPSSLLLIVLGAAAVCAVVRRKRT